MTYLSSKGKIKKRANNRKPDSFHLEGPKKESEDTDT